MTLKKGYIYQSLTGHPGVLWKTFSTFLLSVVNDVSANFRNVKLMIVRLFSILKKIDKM